MKKRKAQQLEAMPRRVRVFLVTLALIFVALIFAANKLYLPNWRGNIVFLPVALFIGVLLITAVVSHLLRKR